MKLENEQFNTYIPLRLQTFCVHFSGAQCFKHNLDCRVNTNESKSVKKF